MFSWNFATFLRTTFFYRTPSVAASEKKTWNYLAQIHEDSFQGVLGNDSTENFRDPLTTQLTFLLVQGNNINTRKRCEICWRRSGDFIVHFEHILHILLKFLLLTSKKYMVAGKVPLISSSHIPT